MIHNLPSIFNDVIGPVMRGPSSSHTAASWRIAKLCLDILDEPLEKALVEFDQDGAWASNFREQGTEMGLVGGLQGFDIEDQRMVDAVKYAFQRGLAITFKVNSFPTSHPNTVRMTLFGANGNTAQILAVSTGGGSFEIRQINGNDIQLGGGYFELIAVKNIDEPLPEEIKKALTEISPAISAFNEIGNLVNLKSSKKISSEVLRVFEKSHFFSRVMCIQPILPVVLGNETFLPFATIPELIQFACRENKDAGAMGLFYEGCMSGLSEKELLRKMQSIICLVHKSIETGLQGTNYADRILQQQSHLLAKAEKAGKIMSNSLVNNIIAGVTAIMESKSAMEVIVANPTAGSCGVVGGVLKAVADETNASMESLTRAYFAAGIIGACFAAGPGFSAEAYGCQVECGAASGMAAAGIVQLLGGTTIQAFDAASMAIQNIIGLICDPVADRVEVPCLGKNVSAAVNALSAATMACSGFDAVVPLEEVIQTVESVGGQMPACVKCTGKGGLALTKTALEIKDRLSSK